MAASNLPFRLFFRTCFRAFFVGVASDTVSGALLLADFVGVVVVLIGVVLVVVALEVDAKLFDPPLPPPSAATFFLLSEVITCEIRAGRAQKPNRNGGVKERGGLGL